MSQCVKAILGADIQRGGELFHDHALMFLTNGESEVVPGRAIPDGCPVERLDGGVITSGFVDLQVNGGGGVMFNDDQSVETLRTMAEAHASLGTAALLATLITDTPERTRAAIRAVEQAIDARVPGIAGIHLEGPHLSVARKGAHDPNLIRPMDDTDLAMLLDAAARIPNVMVTLAPENATNAQIARLSAAGITVSLGHTDAGYDTCIEAFDAGARCVTHLFNAMSQLGNREPGLVGATLDRDGIYAGLIADAIHVHPAAIRATLAAKARSDRVFLVSDAMATAGSEITEFTLNGRRICRNEHRLTLEDGTLAGADLDMPRAISTLIGQCGQDLNAALARATTLPSELLRPETLGAHLGGYYHLSADFSDCTRLSTNPHITA